MEQYVQSIYQQNVVEKDLVEIRVCRDNHLSNSFCRDNSREPIESNVIHRNKYENSPLVLAPWYLRTLKLDGRELTSADIKDSQIVAWYPAFKQHWEMCNTTCRFRDCVVESLFPFASEPDR